LAKELEKQRRFDVLELMSVREVKKNTPQYRDFVNHRLPAMQRKGLNGLTITVSDRRGPTCCFNNDNRFRGDLEEHIIQDHLSDITLELFKNLTIYYCNICKTTTKITCIKSTHRSYYAIIRKCGCKPKNPHKFTQPWSQLTFLELCNEFLRYNHSVKQKFTAKKFSIYNTNERSKTIQIDTNSKLTISALDSQNNCYKKTMDTLSARPSDSIITSQSIISPEHDKFTDCPPNQHNIQSSTINHALKQNKTDDLRSCSSSGILLTTKTSNTAVTTEEHQTRRNIKTSKSDTESIKPIYRHNKTKKPIVIHHHVSKSCCNIS
jgi:hypothetical protein